MTVLISFAAFLLYGVVCDFPPSESETTSERIFAIASAIISWPVIALTQVLPENTAGILALPILILPGLFWAAFTEVLMIAKMHAGSKNWPRG